MQVSKHILEELEFSPGYCDKRYGDKFGPGTYVLFKDHHNYDGYVFRAEHFDQFAEACKAMVLMRLNYGWYPNKREEMPEQPYTQEEIDATPQKLQSFVSHEMKKWNSGRIEAMERNDFIEMAELAASDHEMSGYAAILIVERREDHEDEGWCFYKLLDPYEFFNKIRADVDKKKAKKKLPLKRAA